jgi:hypothetical protein
MPISFVALIITALQASSPVQSTQLARDDPRQRITAIVTRIQRADAAFVNAKVGKGTRFIFRAAGTRHEADILASEASPETTTAFAVRPYWGMPAKDWIAADPEFWQPNPVARSR